MRTWITVRVGPSQFSDGDNPWLYIGKFWSSHSRVTHSNGDILTCTFRHNELCGHVQDLGWLGWYHNTVNMWVSLLGLLSIDDVSNTTVFIHGHECWTCLPRLKHPGNPFWHPLCLWGILGLSLTCFHQVYLCCTCELCLHPAGKMSSPKEIIISTQKLVASCVLD